jgi:hypothetical protein
MPKHVVLTIEMGIDDLPDTATDYDYGCEVLKNLIESKPALDEMGHQVWVSDDDNPCWRTAPRQDAYWVGIQYPSQEKPFFFVKKATLQQAKDEVGFRRTLDKANRSKKKPYIIQKVTT